MCNGLVISDLIQYLRCLYKVKKETNFTDAQIIEVFISKTESPLLDVMLSCKSQDLATVKQELLKNFVPVSTRENLVRIYVNKPQEVSEPLHLYINRVKEFSELLNCSYSESELVDLIHIGLNPRCRVNIAGLGKLKTVREFEIACIHNQNVEASNNLRELGVSNVVRRPVVNQMQNNVINGHSNVKTCYSCDRKGHIARQCYRSPKTNK